MWFKEEKKHSLEKTENSKEDKQAENLTLKGIKHLQAPQPMHINHCDYKIITIFCHYSEVFQNKSLSYILKKQEKKNMKALFL